MSLGDYIKNASPMMDYAFGIAVVGVAMIFGSYMQASKIDSETRRLAAKPYKLVSREADGRLCTKFEDGKVFYSAPEDKRIAQSR